MQDNICPSMSANDDALVAAWHRYQTERRADDWDSLKRTAMYALAPVPFVGGLLCAGGVNAAVAFGAPLALHMLLITAVMAQRRSDRIVRTLDQWIEWHAMRDQGLALALERENKAALHGQQELGTTTAN